MSIKENLALKSEIFAKMFYEVDIEIFTDENSIKPDYGTVVRPTPKGGLEIYLLKENRFIELPTNEYFWYIRGKTRPRLLLYSNKRGSYYKTKVRQKYFDKDKEGKLPNYEPLKLNLQNTKFIDVIPESDREWFVQGVKTEVMLAKEEKDWKQMLAENMPIIASGVFCFMIVIAIVVFWRMILSEMLDKLPALAELLKLPIAEVIRDSVRESLRNETLAPLPNR